MSILTLCVFGVVFAADLPTTTSSTNQRPVMLVQFQSNLENIDALFATLSVANKLCQQDNNVILFLDLKAVTLSDKELKYLTASRRSDARTQLDDFVAHGGKIIVCPHCAKQMGLNSSSLRKGATMTSKEELAQHRKTADKIYEYHEPEKPAAVKSSI